jgi:hypothetical protein
MTSKRHNPERWSDNSGVNPHDAQRLEIEAREGRCRL